MTNTKPIQITATFFRAERLHNTVNGGPRFKLHTSDGVLVTASDTSMAWDVLNHDGRPEHNVESWRCKEVRFTITPTRKVYDWELA